MISSSLSELHKRQALIEEAVYDALTPQIKELYDRLSKAEEEIQLLKEKITKLENERQIQSNKQEE